MGRNTHLVEVYIESNEERPCLHAVLRIDEFCEESGRLLGRGLFRRNIHGHIVEVRASN